MEFGDYDENMDLEAKLDLFDRIQAEIEKRQL
jgi:hypothetical protein